MYQPQTVLITQQPNNRLPSPQAAAGEGATLLAATSGSHITNISLDIWLTMNLKTRRGHGINTAVLWTGKPNQQILFVDIHLERSVTHETAPPSLFAAVFRVAKLGKSHSKGAHHDLLE